MNTNDSFESRLVALQKNMLNFALTLVQDMDQAKDLVQETLLRALDNRDKYYDNINFKGWIFTIMHNLFVNNYRRWLRNHTIVDHTQNLYHLNIPRDSGQETSEGTYTIAEINKAIGSFTDDYRLPFTMHISGYKYEEIARKLNLPLGTVKSRIFFARKRLQALLKDYGPDSKR